MSVSPRILAHVPLQAELRSKGTSLRPSRRPHHVRYLLCAFGFGSLTVLPAVSANAQGLRSNVATITLLVSKPQGSGAERSSATRDASGALPADWATADEVRVEIAHAATASLGERESPRFFVRDSFRRFAPLQTDSGVLVHTSTAATTIVSFRALMPPNLAGTTIVVRYRARWERDSARVEQLDAVVAFPSPVSRAR